MTDNAAPGGSPPPSARGHNVAALVLGLLLIAVIVGGNALVCVSVLTEKALKTTTNYFIVNLAVADLLLAVLVLPLFVYSEVSSYLPAASLAKAVQLDLVPKFQKERKRDFFLVVLQ